MPPSKITFCPRLKTSRNNINEIRVKMINEKRSEQKDEIVQRLEDNREHVLCIFKAY
jgi:hypothetical protein